MNANLHHAARVTIAVALLACAVAAGAQPVAYPNRPIRVIVPYPPGGGIDPLARAYAQKLNEAWGQPVLVDNKPGAATIIGTDFVAKAPADGYTVLLTATSLTVNPVMYSKMPFDTVKDLAPISLVARFPQLLAVNPQVPVNSVKELIVYLKAKPGTLNFPSNGNGSTQHLAGELFKFMAGVDMAHVPYKGSGPATMSVVSGETQVVFESYFILNPQIKAGKLRALAIGGAERSPLVPDLPTVAESGLPGFDHTAWAGFLAPAGTPREVTLKWYREVSRIVQVPEFRERQLAQGVEPVGTTPELFAQYIRSEIGKWAGVAKNAGIKLD